jgi:hypothetical protein
MSKFRFNKAELADDYPKSYYLPSDKPCPHCGGEMTKGDEICGDICTRCYWEMMDKAQEETGDIFK